MTTPFQLLQDDWIRIAPLGDHPHQLGIQRIDNQAVSAMANRFNSFSARLGRLFSGVPLFEGHHDTDPEKYPNGKKLCVGDGAPGPSRRWTLGPRKMDQ